jgi:sortase A
MKHKILFAIGALLLLAGLAVLLYPTAKTAVLHGKERDSIEAFEKYVETAQAAEPTSQSMSPEDGPLSTEPEAGTPEPARIFPELWEACVAFNEQLPKTQRETYTEDSMRRPSLRLSDYGWEQEVFGYISIPAVGIEAPLYLGASSAHMDVGAAILGQTSMPIGGESTHCVIAGHRTWSGAIQFKGLEQLAVGDRVYLTNPWETLTYEVIEIKTVLPDVTDEIMVQKGRDLITVFTCTYPNSRRLLVTCERVEEGGTKSWKPILLPWVA